MTALSVAFVAHRNASAGCKDAISDDDNVCNCVIER